MELFVTDHFQLMTKKSIFGIWDFFELPQNSNKIKSTTKSQKVPYDWIGTVERLSRIFWKFLIKWNTFSQGKIVEI